MAENNRGGNKKLEEAGALWEEESQNGRRYWSGRLADGRKIVGFENTSKKNDKEPDIRIYIQDNQDGNGPRRRQEAPKDDFDPGVPF